MPPLDFEPTVPQFLRHVTERFGERRLISLGERRLGYAEAEAESARLACGLLARGVGKGTRVGVLFGNGPDWVISWLAAARIGALVVPINTFYQARELGWTLRHADIHTLLTTARLLSHDYQERLEQCAPSLRSQKASRQILACPELPCLRQVFVFGGDPRAWASSVDALREAGDAQPGIDAALLREVEAAVCPADALVVIYSSGSTAEPKGAVHTHGVMLRQAHGLNRYRDATPDDRIWSPMPFFWVGGLVVSLLQNMNVGASLLCQDAFEPGETLAMLERERATSALGWPQYMQAMRDHPDFARRDLSSLNSSFPEQLAQGESPPDMQLRSNSLGMTETCGPHTYDRMDVDLPESLRGSFGRAVEGVEHKVIDPETGEILAPGEHGEICVRGRNLMQGLYKREREDVFDADGFYHTGDAGHFDAEGYLFFKARLGEMIKTGGANVTPREVEVVVEEQPEVQSCFVVGVPHPHRGQNVAAAIVLNEGAALSPDELRLRLRNELSAYKLPRHVFFCTRDELPFTDSGKIQKAELARILGERVAESEPG
ncbi:MAG: AMP-binding protein [Myxococcota bacterium]|nr:AMP-binding protein [Myxococcota bacterium]